MFCPNCGKAEQAEKTFCRQCGKFLPDLSKAKKENPQTPADQFRLSLVFNLLSAFAGIFMALALLIVHWGKPGTHPVIYAAISLLTVISGWQIASFFNNLNLIKRFVRGTEENKETGMIAENEIRAKSLPEADFTDTIPASVTERTTRNLKEKV